MIHEININWMFPCVLRIMSQLYKRQEKVRDLGIDFVLELWKLQLQFKVNHYPQIKMDLECHSQKKLSNPNYKLWCLLRRLSSSKEGLVVLNVRTTCIILWFMNENVIRFWFLIPFSVLNFWEYANKYRVLDSKSNQIYHLQEESNCMMRWCCKNGRALRVSFQTNQGKEILSFNRPLRCLEAPSDCCYPNWTQVKTWSLNY